MKLLNIKEVQDLLLSLMKEMHTYLGEKNIRYYLLGGSALGAVRHGGFIPWDDDIDIGMFRDDYEKFLSVCGDFNPGYEIVNYRNAKQCDFCLTRIYFPGTMIDDKSISATKLDKRLYFDIFPLDNVPDNEAERSALEKAIKKRKKLIADSYVRDYGNSATVLFAKRLRAMCIAPFRGTLLKKCDRMMQTYRNDNTEYVCSICSQYSFSKQAMPKEYYGEPRLHAFEDAEFFVPEQTDKYLSHLYGADYMKIPPENKRRKGHDIYLSQKE